MSNIYNKYVLVYKESNSSIHMAILFRTIGLLANKYFQVVRISDLLTINVPYQGYSRSASCALN